MDRFTWGIVVGALLLVAAGLASVTLLQRAPPPPDLTRPEGVVRAYIEAIDAGRPEAAWDLLADSARSGVARDEFIRRATSFRRGSSTRVAIEQVEVEGRTARVELSRTFGGGGGPFGLFGPSSFTDRFTVRLEQEGGQWRITVPPEPFLIQRAVVPPAPAPAAPPGTQTPAATPAPTPAASG